MCDLVQSSLCSFLSRKGQEKETCSSLLDPVQNRPSCMLFPRNQYETRVRRAKALYRTGVLRYIPPVQNRGVPVKGAFLPLTTGGGTPRG